MQKINIPTIGLFHIPESQDYIMDWISKLPPSERMAATVAYGMTWNYIATKIKEAQADDNQD